MKISDLSLHTHQPGRNRIELLHIVLAGLWGKGYFHTLLVVLQKGTANMDSNLSIAYKARHTLAMSLDIDSREMKA